jgi:Peptidase family M1 domain
MWRTLSNGILAETTSASDRRVDVWRTSQRLARSFIAGPYVVSWHRVDRTSVGVFLLPHHADRAREYAAAVPPMVRILAQRFGPYPFETFGIAAVPRSLAPPGFVGRSEQGYFVAHTDALDGPAVSAVFAHELAHMWFGNAVVARPGDDMMDEAIANYAVALVREITNGEGAATAELVDGHPAFSARGYFHYARLGVDQPLMANPSPITARAKGPWVYRMLRDRVGDRVFFGTLQAFVRRYAGRSRPRSLSAGAASRNAARRSVREATSWHTRMPWTGRLSVPSSPRARAYVVRERGGRAAGRRHDGRSDRELCRSTREARGA